MERCVIFCAGGFDALAEPLGENALVIAADGGLRHTQALGITPDVILGDFDSLGYTPESARVYPVRKDDTDLMLAIRHGLAAGCREFLIYGAMDGPRPDHTLAALQSLCFLAERGCHGQSIGLSFAAAAVKNGSLIFPHPGKQTVSVFCMGADARGVTLEGLSYPLEDGVLRADFPLGVSNRFLGAPARVSVREGTLVCLWEREGGLCHPG